jgi:quercetin dioxygenase-like cupin family protein
MSITANKAGRAMKKALGLVSAGQQKMPVGIVVTAMMLALGGMLLLHDEKKEVAGWLADLCTSISRPMFSSAPLNIDGSGVVRPATASRVISCEPLPNVPGKSVTTLLVDFPPLAYSPAHRHPGSVTAVILEGTIRSQLAGTPPGDYRLGETFFEPPGTLHVFAENPDPVHPARLVAMFVADENCGPLVLPP